MQKVTFFFYSVLKYGVYVNNDRLETHNYNNNNVSEYRKNIAFSSPDSSSTYNFSTITKIMEECVHGTHMPLPLAKVNSGITPDLKKW